VNRNSKSCRANALKRWHGEYKPVPCPRCRSSRTIHRGYRDTKKAGKIQTWLCKACGRRWMEQLARPEWKRSHRLRARANRPRCLYCQRFIKAGRYCSREHGRLVARRQWQERHAAGRRAYFRTRSRLLRPSMRRTPDGCAIGMANLGGGGQTGCATEGVTHG